MTEQPEELEHIPWSALADQASRTNRAWYVAAAAVALVAVGLVMSRTLLAGGPAVVEPAAPPTTLAAAVGDIPTTTEASSPPLYSEADLMAAITAEIDRSVAAHAEWFVTDYFTRDFDHHRSAYPAEALPAGSELPDLPHDIEPGAGPIIYVEWARSLRVAELTPGRHRVLVAYRTIAEQPGGEYVRQDVRAVEVLVALGADGGVTVLDLPSPVVIPSRPEAIPFVPAIEPAPAVVHEAVAAHLGSLGIEVEDVRAAPVGGGFRVQAIAGYDGMTSWPVAFHVDEQGRILALGEIG